jgi:hypothetical protein
VAEGIFQSSCDVKAVEIVDLQSQNIKCSMLPNSEYFLDGSIGGLNENEEPWICGGSCGSTYQLCWTYKAGSWKRTENLNYKRAYSGISQLANGSYFITGGINDRPWEPFGKTELLSNQRWIMSSPDLPEPIYQHCQVAKNYYFLLNSLTVFKSFSLAFISLLKVIRILCSVYENVY